MRILFQGDSITDAGRSRENDGMVGVGYPLFVKAELGYEEMEKNHKFFNRGVGGNRVTDVYARIKRDILNLKPDVMSILIGVNDVWHELGEQPNGVSNEKFYKIYTMLIQEIKEELPDIKIMILEPFVLKASATEANWDYFKSEVAKRAETAKRVAEENGLTFIPLQDGFDKLCERAEESEWLADGVHPTSFGHIYIKNEWIKAYKNLR